jgi:hypothetical protein
MSGVSKRFFIGMAIFTVAVVVYWGITLQKAVASDPEGEEVTAVDERR